MHIITCPLDAHSHLSIRMHVPFPQQENELLLGEVDVDISERDHVEGEVPAGVLQEQPQPSSVQEIKVSPFWGTLPLQKKSIIHPQKISDFIHPKAPTPKLPLRLGYRKHESFRPNNNFKTMKRCVLTHGYSHLSGIEMTSLLNRWIAHSLLRPELRSAGGAGSSGSPTSQSLTM